MKKLKHIIALVCLLTLSIQMLPLRQIGSLLSSNQLQEELPHSIDSAKCPAKSFPYTDVILESFATSATTLADASEYFHFASVLPPSHVGEIHTPPPNTIGQSLF